MTRYQIAVDAGVEYSAVHRFMARERGLTVETFDKLCAALGLAPRTVPGAVVPNAQVTAVNIATNTTRVTQTDASGNYLLPSLPIGTYRLEVQASGMGRQVMTGLVLDVGRNVAQNFTVKQIGRAHV